RTKTALATNCNRVTLFASPFEGEGWRAGQTIISNPSPQSSPLPRGRGGLSESQFTQRTCVPRKSLASQPFAFQCFIIFMKRFLILHVFGALLVTMAQGTTNFDLAAKATNELGIDLYRQLAAGDENLCISPYSINSALAMTFAGADGVTRSEMARVLHFPNGGDVPASFSALQRSLEQMSAKTAELVKESKKFGGPSEPITLNIANRLFAQK